MLAVWSHAVTVWQIIGVVIISIPVAGFALLAISEDAVAFFGACAVVGIICLGVLLASGEIHP